MSISRYRTSDFTRAGGAALEDPSNGYYGSYPTELDWIDLNAGTAFTVLPDTGVEKEVYARVWTFGPNMPWSDGTSSGTVGYLGGGDESVGDRWFVIDTVARSFRLVGTLTMSGQTLTFSKPPGSSGYLDEVLVVTPGEGYASLAAAETAAGEGVDEGGTPDGGGGVRRIHRLGIGGNLGVRR